MELIHLIKILTMACVVQYRTTTACYESNLKAECSDLSLTKVPTDLNFAINTLDLSENPITKLGPTDLETYTELEILLLSECKLEVLPKAIFKNLRKLIKVDLAGNKLSSIPSNIFEYNKILRTVVLDRNALQTPILKSLSVETLRLSGCAIEYIDDETFSGMTNLKMLDLTGNIIQRVTANAFSNNNLKELCIDSVQYLKEIQNKLCNDKVAIKTDCDSTFHQLCFLQITYNSTRFETNGNVQTEGTQTFTVETTVISSDKYTEPRYNQDNADTPTTSTLYTSPSTQKILQETISTVDSTTMTDSLTNGINSSPSVTPTPRKMFNKNFSTAIRTTTTDSLTNFTVSSPTNTPTSRTMFHDNLSTVDTTKTKTLLSDVTTSSASVTPTSQNMSNETLSKDGSKSTTVWFDMCIVLVVCIVFMFILLHVGRRGKVGRVTPQNDSVENSFPLLNNPASVSESNENTTQPIED